MVTVPGFLLRRLYVKKSLRNSPDGVRFELKNSLGSGYAKSMIPVEINGLSYPMENTTFEVDGAEVLFSTVTDEARFTLALNKAITVVVKGAHLNPGNHALSMGFIVPGLGQLKFNVKDEILP